MRIHTSIDHRNTRLLRRLSTMFTLICLLTSFVTPVSSPVSAAQAPTAVPDITTPVSATPTVVAAERVPSTTAITATTTLTTTATATPPVVALPLPTATAVVTPATQPAQTNSTIASTIFAPLVGASDTLQGAPTPGATTRACIGACIPILPGLSDLLPAGVGGSGGGSSGSRAMNDQNTGEDKILLSELGSPGCYRFDVSASPITDIGPGPSVVNSPTRFYIGNDDFNRPNPYIVIRSGDYPDGRRNYITTSYQDGGPSGSGVWGVFNVNGGGFFNIIGFYKTGGTISWQRVEYINEPNAPQTAKYCAAPTASAPVAQPNDGCGSTATPGTVPQQGDPVDLRDSSWFFQLPCLSLGGAGIPIHSWLRYSTRLHVEGRGDASVGSGWSVSYNRRALYDASLKRATVLYENGDRAFYSQNTDGSFTGATTWTTLTRNATSGQITLQYADSLKESYGADGALTRMEDRYGNALTRTWSVENNGTLGRIRIANSRTGQAIDFIHEKRDENIQVVWKLTRITDWVGNGNPQRSVNLSYNTSGQLTSITDEASAVYTFAYDAQGRIAKYYDPNNNPAVLGGAAKATVNSYDPTRKQSVVSQVARDGTVTNYAVEGSDLAVTARPSQANQRIVRYTRNRFGAITKITNPNTTTAYARFEYDDTTNKLTRSCDQMNRCTQYSYTPTTWKDLTTIIAPNGLDTTTMEYNAFSQMTKLTDPEGLVTKWTYDATTGAPLTMTRTDNVTTYTTTYKTDPVSIKGASVRTGLVTAVQQPNGAWMTQAYDTYGYPTTTTYDANVFGNTNRLAVESKTSYDWRGFLLRSTNMAGIETSYSYAQDASKGQYGNRGTPTSVTIVAGVTMEYTTDAVGNITKVVADVGTNRLNRTTNMAYAAVGTDGAYLVTQVTDPLNQVVKYEYSAYAELTKVTEVGALPAGGDRTTTLADTYLTASNEWQHTTTLYDQRAIATTLTDASGQVKKTTDARGVTATYEYDANGRIYIVKQGTTALTASLPASSNTTYYTYDRNGQIKLIRTNDGQYSTRDVVDNTYDTFGRLKVSKDGSGNQTTYAYDVAANTMTVTAGANTPADQVVTVATYDSLGRVTQQVVDPGTGRKNLTTRYGYTNGGFPDKWHLQKVTEPEMYRLYSNYVDVPSTTYAYSELGQLARTTDALGRSWNYTYNPVGDLTGMTDGRAVNETYTVDALGRTTQLQRQNNTITENWEYNIDGTLKTTTDMARRVTRYGYDTTGRLTSVDRDGTDADATYTYLSNDLLATAKSKPDGTVEVTTSYGYDAANRLSTRTRDGRTVTYGYRPDNALTSIDYWGQGTTTYAYKPNGLVDQVNPWNKGATTYAYRATNQLASVTRPNSTKTDLGYDTAARLTSITTTRGATTVHKLTYGLDDNGNATSQDEEVNGVAWGQTLYSYDFINRLTHVQQPSIPNGPPADTQNYVYDEVGNRIAAADVTTNGLLQSDDFQAGTSTGWTPVTGTWRVVDTAGNKTYQQTSATTSNAVTGDATWRDYTVQADVKLPTSPNSTGAIITGRFQQDGSYYQLAIARSSTGVTYLELGKFLNGVFTRLAYRATTLEANRTYTLQLSFRGNQILGRTSSDGGTTFQNLPTVIDSTFTTGKAGLGTWNAAAIFDNVKVFAALPALITSNPVLASDDFQDGNSNGWTILSGTWNVADLAGGKVYQQTTAASSGAVTGDTAWRDYTVQADVQLPTNPNSTGVAITGRFQSGWSYYQLAIAKGYAGETYLELGKFVNGVFSRLAYRPMTLETNRTYTLQLNFRGNQLTGGVSTNGGASYQYLSTVVDNSFASGKISVGTWNAAAVFDNVKVFLAEPALASDFESGTATGWTPEVGTWNVVSAGGGKAYQLAPATTAAATAGETGWRDYTLQSDVQIATDGNSTSAALRGHVQNYGFYQFGLVRDLNGAKAWQLIKFVNGQLYGLGGGAYTYSANTTYTLRMEFFGSKITTWIRKAGDANFQLLGVVYDTSMPTGKVGLATWNVSATFDNVRVEPITELRYDDADRIINPGYSYDANGSLTATPDGMRYTYDAANRLTRTVKDGVTVDYQYDALGNMIRQKVTQGTVATTTDFVLDESGGLTHVLGSITNGSTTLYGYGPNGLQAVKNADGSVAYPLTDRLGSVRAYADATGTLTRATSYDPWGVIRHETTKGTGGALGFAGEQANPDGTTHLRARAYKPETGRFLQRDTFAGFLANAPSLNRYSYTHNNPVNNTDPSGHIVLAGQQPTQSQFSQDVGHWVDSNYRPFWLWFDLNVRSTNMSGMTAASMLSPTGMVSPVTLNNRFRATGPLFLPFRNHRATCEVRRTGGFGGTSIPMSVRESYYDFNYAVGGLAWGNGLRPRDFLLGGFADLRIANWERHSVVGTTDLGVTFTAGANGPRVEALAGSLMGTTGLAVGGSLASWRSGLGINLLGQNFRVVGEVGAKLEIGATVGPEQLSINGPFVGVYFITVPAEGSVRPGTSGPEHRAYLDEITHGRSGGISDNTWDR